MKTTASYLLLINLFFLTSCQEQYSEVEIQQEVLWNETIQRTNLILKRNISTKIKKAIKDIETKVQYKPFLPKFKYITTQSDSIFNEIERLKDILLEQSEAYTPSTETIPTKALTKNIQSSYNNYLHLIEKSWDNGGVKTTVFADIRKKKSVIQEIKASLDLPILSQIRTNPAYLERQLKDKPLAAVLTFLSSIQNDIRKQEYHVFHFFDKQISRIHDYTRINLCSVSNKHYVRLGETYKTEILWSTNSTEAFRSIIINGNSTPIVDERASYKIKPNQTGEQTYHPTLTFLNPYTNTIDSIQKTFYFNVKP
jgi:hypothetical protein